MSLSTPVGSTLYSNRLIPLGVASEHKIVKYDELGVPRELYKYRCWDNRNHKSLLTKREVFMAAPSTFEDEKDALMSTERFKLTYDTILNEYFKISQDEHPEADIEEHRTIAIKLAEECNLAEFTNRILNDYASLDSCLGILSLTQASDNFKLWNYYANNGNGFCVGLDTRYLFRFMKRGAEVAYYEQLPLIDIDEELDTQIYKHVFCKEEKWHFEHEYRLCIYNKEGLKQVARSVIMPKEAFAEVVFGFNLDAISKQKIINVCKAGGLKPRLMQANLVNGIVTLHQSPIVL
jgi:hypothetical protein